MPGRWTQKRVEALMVEAFRQLPSTPIYSPAKNVACEALGAQGHLPPGPHKVLIWSARYLGRETRERIALLTWARHRAMPAEKSLRCICKGHGWAWSTFNEARRRGARRIAKNLNVDGVRLFDQEWHYLPSEKVLDTRTKRAVSECPNIT